jgi:hypothetical protein
MAWDRRALGVSWVLLAVAACSGNAFRTEVGSAGSSGSGNGHAGAAAQGGNGAMGGKPTLAGSAGLGTSSGSPSVAGAAGEGEGQGEGGAGGAPPQLPPIPIDGLVYWFKADADAVEKDGGVSEWLDQSGNGHHAQQSLAEQRPKLVRSERLPVLELDGINDFLELPPIDLDVSTGLSFFAVAQRREERFCSGVLELSNLPEEEDISFDSTGDSYQFEILGATAKASPGVFPNDSMRLLESVYTVDGTSGTGEMYINGGNVGSLEMPPPQDITREKNFIGESQYNDCTPFPGAIGEIIMYERPVSYAERKAIESYLKLKWQCCG